MSWIATPESSNIVGFDYAKEGQILTVEFKNGVRYNYFDISEFLYTQLKAASSKGQFLAQNIKGKYRYARV